LDGIIFQLGGLFNEAKLNSMQKRKERESLFSPPQAVSILFRLEGNGWWQRSFSTGAMMTLTSLSIINPRQDDTGQHKYVLPEPSPCQIQ
jgi:hypothetical protein